MLTHEPAQKPKSDTELAVIVFMLIFWPLLFVLGVIDHFFMPDHDLRLFSLVFAAAAGWVGVLIQRRRNVETS